MKTRILYVIDDLVIGGAERILVELLTGLDRDRFDADVLTLFPGEGLTAELEDCGFSCRNLALTKFNIVAVAFRLRRIIKEGNYPIVQLIRPVSRIIGMLSVCGLRDIHLIARYDSMVSCELSRFRIFERKVLKRSRKIISPSRAVVDDLFLHCRVDPEKFLISYNGIRNGHHVVTSGVEKVNGGIVVGTIGNVSWKKGFENGLLAIKKLKEAVPDIKYQIVGRDDKQSSLTRMVKDFGLTDTVDLLGEVRDVRLCLDNWSIYFQPSLTEGFGLAVLEAMSYAKPIVASNVGGIPELIESGVTGLLVDPEQIDSMANALSQLINTPSLAQELGLNAAKTASEKFNCEKMIQDHEKLYTSILETQSGDHE